MDALPVCQSKSIIKPGVSNLDEENTKRKRHSIADGTQVAKTRLFAKIIATECLSVKPEGAAG
jgi:hypothetical protein